MEVQVTDQLLLQLAADRRVQASAPVFKRLRGAARRRGCGKCRKKAGNQVSLMRSIKQSVVSSEKLRNIIKRITGAKRLAVHLRVGNRVVKRVV